MNYGTVFFFLGVAASGGLYLFPSLAGRVIWGYTAFGFLAVAVVYYLNRPRFWLKRPDGRLSPLSYFVFGPAHLLSNLSFGLFRRQSRRPPFVQIVPGLFLGRRLVAAEEMLIRDANLAGVLDLTAEFWETGFLRRAPNYRWLPVLDTNAPTLAQVAEGVEFIQRTLPAGPVYVHCALGHGRSAVVVMAYLLATGQCRDAVEALQFVKFQRPGVSLMTGQWAILCAWEQTCRKKT